MVWDLREMMRKLNSSGIEPVSREYFINSKVCAYPEGLTDLISNHISEETKEQRKERQDFIYEKAGELLDRHDLSGSYWREEEMVRASIGMYDLLPNNEIWVPSKIEPSNLGKKIAVSFKFRGFMGKEHKERLLDFAAEYMNTLTGLYTFKAWDTNVALQIKEKSEAS